MRQFFILFVIRCLCASRLLWLLEANSENIKKNSAHSFETTLQHNSSLKEKNYSPDDHNFHTLRSLSTVPTGCGTNCGNCSTFATLCTTCLPGFSLKETNGSCVVACRRGYYEEGGVCITCDPSCETCSGSATQCVTCGSGKYLQISDSTCQLCPFGCQECNKNSFVLADFEAYPPFCTVCKIGFFFRNGGCAFELGCTSYDYYWQFNWGTVPASVLNATSCEQCQFACVNSQGSCSYYSWKRGDVVNAAKNACGAGCTSYNSTHTEKNVVPVKSCSLCQLVCNTSSSCQSYVWNGGPPNICPLAVDFPYSFEIIIPLGPYIAMLSASVPKALPIFEETLQHKIASFVGVWSNQVEISLGFDADFRVVITIGSWGLSKWQQALLQITLLEIASCQQKLTMSCASGPFGYTNSTSLLSTSAEKLIYAYETSLEVLQLVLFSGEFTDFSNPIIKEIVSSITQDTIIGGCTLGCADCRGASSCKVCNYNLYLYNNSCVQKCPDGTFPLNGSCNFCSQPNCATCSEETACDSCGRSSYLLQGVCYTTCPLGTYEEVQQGKCLRCAQGCSRCSQTSGGCQSCFPEYYISDANCVMSCPFGTYPLLRDLSSGECVPCAKHCLFCDKKGICQECDDNYYLTTQGGCSALTEGETAATVIAVVVPVCFATAIYWLTTSRKGKQLVSRVIWMLSKKGVHIIECKFPMWVCKKVCLLKLECLITHEDALQQNLILKLPAYHDRSTVLFVSHRWLQNPHPDDAENSKLAQLKALLENPEFSKIEYVWFDFLCIPQAEESQTSLQAAVDSLPYYISYCSHFVTLVGDVGRATIEVYKARGWCRLERFAAASPIPDGHGNINKSTTWEHNKTSSSLTKVLVSLCDSSQANPLEGDFVEDADKDRIAPTLITLCSCVENFDGDANMRAQASYIKEQALARVARLKSSSLEESEFSKIRMMNFQENQCETVSVIADLEVGPRELESQPKQDRDNCKSLSCDQQNQNLEGIACTRDEWRLSEPGSQQKQDTGSVLA